MQKHLNFICPTDHLETVIQQTFKQKNYFYTSLGNSVMLDSETVGQINEIIESKNINEVTFFLSRDNEIIQRALRNHKYRDIKGIRDLHPIIENQIQNLNFNQPIPDIELLFITNYLTEKVNKLRQILVKRITIKALVYNRQNDVFIEANTDFFKRDYFCLN